MLSRVERQATEKLVKKQQRKKKTKKLLLPLLSLLKTMKNNRKLSQEIIEEESLTSEVLNNDIVDVQHFIEIIALLAQNIGRQYDLYASVLIAQALIESDYGRSKLAQPPFYNLFGIRNFNNQYSVYFSNAEYHEGQWMLRKQPIRRYSSYYSSMVDQANILRLTSFDHDVYHYSETWKRNTNSYLEATACLAQTYSPDPDYGLKLNKLIQKYDLIKYDTPSVYTSPSVEVKQVNMKNLIIVQKGDTLCDLAKRHNLSVEELMQKNNLTSEVLWVGLTLYV